MKKKSISIIICFYNASEKLIPTLQHIKALDISSVDSCELLLINNNSDDNSDDIIHKELSEFALIPWQIIQEPNPGLNNARMCGIRYAKYEYLLFVDDDNWLESNYILNGLKILQKNNNIGVLGGFGHPVSDIALPNWFCSYENFYAVGPQMPQNGIVHGVRNVVYGAGMFVRKSALDYIFSKGFSFFSTDRTGTSLASGGDSELCLVIKIAGFDIWYDDSLQFNHFIEPRRLTQEYISNLQNGMNSSGYVTKFYRQFLFGYNPKITKYFWVKEFMYSVKDLIKGLFVNQTKLDIRRNVDFTLYLLREKARYNDNVRMILKICENLNMSKNL